MTTRGPMRLSDESSPRTAAAIVQVRTQDREIVLGEIERGVVSGLDDELTLGTEVDQRPERPGEVGDDDEWPSDPDAHFTVPQAERWLKEFEEGRRYVNDSSDRTDEELRENVATLLDGFRHHAHLALGHKSWEQFCKVRFLRLRPSIAEREDALLRLTEAGMSVREVGASLGVSKTTVSAILIAVRNRAASSAPLTASSQGTVRNRTPTSGTRRARATGGSPQQLAQTSPAKPPERHLVAGQPGSKPEGIERKELESAARHQAEAMTGETDLPNLDDDIDAFELLAARVTPRVAALTEDVKESPTDRVEVQELARKVLGLRRQVCGLADNLAASLDVLSPGWDMPVEDDEPPATCL